MKKKNYYSIHKNKKKRKSTVTKQMEALKIVNRVIRNAIILSQRLIELSQTIKQLPNYRLGRNTNEMVLGYEPNSKHNEIIINDYASRSGSNPESILSEMDFGHGSDMSVEQIVSKDGKIIAVIKKGNLFEKQWLDEVTEIDPNQYAKFSKIEDIYIGNSFINIPVPTDFSTFHKLVNEDKLNISNPFLSDYLIDEIKSYKSKPDTPKDNKDEWD